MFYQKSKIIAFVILSVVFFSTVLSSSANSSNRFEKDFGAAVERAAGMNTVVFQTPEGKLRVNLPDDMRAGDTISGTVSEIPNGSSETERQQNSARLDGYVVEIEKTRLTISNKMFKFIVPPNVKGKLNAALRTSAGKQVAKIDVPANVAGLGLDIFPVTPAFSIPPLGQQGRPLQIPGPFDGSFDNTSVQVGDTQAAKLVETPRSSIIEFPPNTPPGITNITIKEGSVETKGQIRSLGINLSSPKTNLMRGEKTTVTVQVSGLEGIKENVPLELVTTGSVNMTGGNTQNIQITPSQVTAGGIYTQNFDLIATQPGGFSVIGTVTNPPIAGGNQDKCKCECELARTPVVTDGTRAGEAAFAPNIAKASCNGNKCSVSSTDYSWTVTTPEKSKAKYTIRRGTDKQRKLVLDVTESGQVTITVTVTITCSDGSTCSATGTATMDVKK